MLRIPCPFCGIRDHTEFSYGGDASVRYPDVGNLDHKAWTAAVFHRENPKGHHHEYWSHTAGCRCWLVVERDTMTHAILAVRPAHPAMAEAGDNAAPNPANGGDTHNHGGKAP